MTGSISLRLDALYAAYLEDRAAGIDPLMAEITDLARRAFPDEDASQEFAIDLWQHLPRLVIRTSFGAFIFRRLQWMKRNAARKQATVAYRFQQIPERVGGDGEPLPSEDVLDSLALDCPAADLPFDLDQIDDQTTRTAAACILDGMTQAEAAKQAGISLRTLQRRLTAVGNKLLAA